MRAWLLVGILCTSTTLWAAECPDCGEGCMPAAWVLESSSLAEGASENCPTDCISITRVKRINPTPSCSVASAEPVPEPAAAGAAIASDTPTPTPPAPAAEVEAAPATPPKETAAAAEAAPEKLDEAASRRDHITDNYIYVMPTARGLDKGTTTISTTMIGIWNVQHGILDNLEIGTYFLLPTMVVGVFPHLVWHGEVSPKLHAGLRVVTGIMSTLGEVFTSFQAYSFGGGGMLTYDDGKNLFNLGVDAHTADFHTEDGWNGTRLALLLPNLAYSFKLNKRWSLFAEATIPLPFTPHSDNDLSLLTFVISYGARVESDWIYGSFGFTCPMSRWYYSFVRFLPISALGMPFFTLGFII